MSALFTFVFHLGVFVLYLYAQAGIIACVNSTKWDGSLIGYVKYVLLWPILIFKEK